MVPNDFTNLTNLGFRPTDNLSGSVVLKSSAGAVVKKAADVKFKDGRGVVQFELAKGEVDLWYPVGYGKQVLYTVEVQVADQVSNIFTWLCASTG
jgi:beta-mannosidase